MKIWFLIRGYDICVLSVRSIKFKKDNVGKLFYFVGKRNSL